MLGQSLCVCVCARVCVHVWMRGQLNRVNVREVRACNVIRGCARSTGGRQGGAGRFGVPAARHAMGQARLQAERDTGL